VTRVLVAVALLAIAAPAAAKSSRELPYPYDPVFSALVRFLRVDERLKVTERDPGAGYVLFELTEGKRTFEGAAEVIKAEDGTGRPVTRIHIRIADRPSYMEIGMLDRLELKLREELGAPAAPPAPAPAPERAPPP
jgi:hypothetical protein